MRWLTGLALTFTLAAVFSGYLQLRLLERAERGETISHEEAKSNDGRQNLVGLIQVGFRMVAWIAFLAWFYGASRNLRALGNESLVEYGPGWAIGGFFVPLLNFFRPYQVMAEVWECSDPRPIELQTPNKGLVRAWWAFFLLSTYIGSLTSTTQKIRSNSIPELIATTWDQMMADLVLVPYFVVVISLVERLTQRQEQSRLNGPELAAIFE